jgi:uncharacterized membrane protein
MSVLEIVLLLMTLLLLGALLAHYLLAWRHRSITGPPAGRQFTSPISRDDERYWPGGMFYYNPDDPDLFVPRRFGIGVGLNYGHPRARLFLFGLLLLVMVVGILAALVGPHTHGHLF